MKPLECVEHGVAQVIEVLTFDTSLLPIFHERPIESGHEVNLLTPIFIHRLAEIGAAIELSVSEFVASTA